MSGRYQQSGKSRAPVQFQQTDYSDPTVIVDYPKPCCEKFVDSFVRPTFFRVIPIAYGLVMAGFTMAALLDRSTAMVTFGGFRWMLLVALIYEFLMFVWGFVESAVSGFNRQKMCNAYFHLLVSIMYIFPFVMFQITWNENKYQDDPNWRSNWGVALGFIMMGSYVPEMIRALTEACPSCSPSQGYSQVTSA